MNSYLFIFSACYSDYFYQNRNSTYYLIRGGASSGGAVCGVFYVYARNNASVSDWGLGAALSFKL